MKAIKIRIKGGHGDREECRKVQEALFKAGYSWTMGKVIQYLEAGFLYGKEDGALSWGQTGSAGLTWFNNPENHPGYVEARLVEQITYGIEEIPGQKETITIGNSVYDKREFEEAVKHLKAIN